MKTDQNKQRRIKNNGCEAETIKILWKHNKQRAYEIQKLHTYGDQYKKDYHDMKDERDELKNKYYELIMLEEG